MKILVSIRMGADWGSSFIPKETEKILESIGEVIWNRTDRNFTKEELKEKVAGADVCLTGWGHVQFDADVVEVAGQLKLIAHTGGSVAPLVSDCLYDKGIRVISGNKIFAESVAEGTIGYILSSLRDIPYYSYDMKNGGWATKGYYNEGLLDQTVGLVGFGMVAKYLVRMLNPFRVKIKTYDPYIKDETLIEYGVEKASLEEIFSTCKIISIHAPRKPETYHMIDRKLLEMIPNSSLLVNTARGNIIDEAALVELLQERRFKTVLDVYEIEPLPPDSVLRKLDNVILMPHMAGPTVDRRKFVTIALIDDIKNFFNGRKLEHEISREYAMSMTR